MTDSDNAPMEGEIVGPAGDGQWVSATTAHVALGISSKTLYRRIERGQIPSRKNALGRIEVWVPTVTEATESPRSLMEPPAAITGLLELITADRATIAGLYADTRALAESAAIWQERAIAADRRADQAERERAAAEAELARARRSWLDRLLGRYPAP